MVLYTYLDCQCKGISGFLQIREKNISSQLRLCFPIFVILLFTEILYQIMRLSQMTNQCCGATLKNIVIIQIFPKNLNLSKSLCLWLVLSAGLYTRVLGLSVKGSFTFYSLVATRLYSRVHVPCSLLRPEAVFCVLCLGG